MRKAAHPRVRDWIAASFAGLAASFPFAARAEVTGGVSIAGEHYAPEPDTGYVLDIGLHLKSESKLNQGDAETQIPAREIHAYDYFQSGDSGEFNVDVDDAVLRQGLGGYGHLWLGRTHPANEGRTDGLREMNTSAIGANWSQNQTYALEPRVSGWIGAGAHLRTGETGFFATAAYSPIFLPTFGPRLELSSDDPASGSRFAHLPPQYVELRPGVVLPLRYQLDTGDLMNIVRQDQGWLSLGYENHGVRAAIVGWSAPSPNPQIATNPKPRVDSRSANVLVIVVPSFPRENFVGGQLSARGLPVPLVPSLEAVNEQVSGRWVISAQISTDLPSIGDYSVGYVDTILSDSAPVQTTGGASISSPLYAQNLYWLQASGPSRWKIIPSFRAELQPDQGFWLKPRITWKATRNLQAFAMASIISGNDNTYFGTWRALDSVQSGVSFVW